MLFQQIKTAAKHNYIEQFSFNHIINDLKVIKLNDIANIYTIDNETYNTLNELLYSRKTWIETIHLYTNNYIKETEELLMNIVAKLPIEISDSIKMTINIDSFTYKLYLFSIIPNIFINNLDLLIN